MRPMYNEKNIMLKPETKNREKSQKCKMKNNTDVNCSCKRICNRLKIISILKAMCLKMKCAQRKSLLGMLDLLEGINAPHTCNDFYANRYWAQQQKLYRILLPPISNYTVLLTQHPGLQRNCKIEHGLSGADFRSVTSISRGEHAIRSS